MCIRDSDKGHDDGADTVGGKGDEHGEGIEKEIPEERAHTCLLYTSRCV